MEQLKNSRKCKKKTKVSKTKSTRNKTKQQRLEKKQRIQLSQEYKETEREVSLLLEQSSLISESSDGRSRFDDNDQTPSEIFFCGTNSEKAESREYDEEDSQIFTSAGDESREKDINLESSDSERKTQPTLASSFIQIDEGAVTKVEYSKFTITTENLAYRPEMNFIFFAPCSKKLNIKRNNQLMLQRYKEEAKSRNSRLSADIKHALENPQNLKRFFPSKILYRTLCDFKFNPVFIEPTRDPIEVPTRKFFTLFIRNLRFTEHPDLKEEHRMANDLEILYEHWHLRLAEKISERLYADLQIERNILQELLRSTANNVLDDKGNKKAQRIEKHMHKVRALREKYYDEEATNKRLLRNILDDWLKLKHLREEQNENFTRLKLRIKVEELKGSEVKIRQSLWLERFEIDLNEIYREKLEEYYQNKRTWQQEDKQTSYFKKPKKPNINEISENLKEIYMKSFCDPQEPRLEIIRTSINEIDFAELPGPGKLQSYFLCLLFDKQVVGETLSYRLERDLALYINEKIGVVLDRRLPRDIKIKLFEKSKMNVAKSIANIIVPLPLSSSMNRENRSMNISFSSHKLPLSGYLRLDLQSEEQIYAEDIVNILFPKPQDHIQIPKHILKEWYDRKFLTKDYETEKEIDENYYDDEYHSESGFPSLANTCTFQETSLQFCDIEELYNNKRWKLLHSRYLKDNPRTSDLRCIPILDHELSFEWEESEEVINQGNWTNPVDLHKHEARKYLYQLYNALQSQCEGLTQMVKSSENLLLNDEPMSWGALFQAIKLMFQPRICVNVDQNTSNTLSTRTLTMDSPQSFKIIFNITRATGIPVRATRSEEESYHKINDKSGSANEFFRQHLKYSNVRPFIAVTYKDKLCRTLAAEGSNPTWNEQLTLSINGTLSELKEDIKISLFDEVIESHYNDDSSVKSVDIYQRIQNNWLGEYRLPLRCLLKQQKLEGIFELSIPQVIVGYKRPSLDNPNSYSEANIMIEQFPEIKDAVYLWCYLCVEPCYTLPVISTQCLECSELMEVEQYLRNWSVEAKRLHSSNYLDPIIGTAEGKSVCLTRLLQPLPPPRWQMNDYSIETASRFVSLISVLKQYNPCLDMTGIWLNNEILLDTTWGSVKDLGVLICNYLLYMGLRCWLILGLTSTQGESAFVLYQGEETAELVLLDPCSAKTYAVKEIFCPLQTIKMIYLNLQTHARVSLMSFNFNDTSCWLPVFNKKNPAPLGGFQNPSYMYRSSYDTYDLRLNIEHKIMKKFSTWRAMRKTIWNRAFQPYLLDILRNLEHNVCSGDSSDELKYNDSLASEFPNYKYYGGYGARLT
uniref:C2 domain-containing protein n=1 Tax=Glossina brevipalpis TaxID=37001 RepID=A0A1A9WZN6_9MUSC